MIDRLLVDLDLITTEEGFGDKIRDAMLTGAEGFLRAGGQVTWDLWASLSGESRDAFIQSAEKIKKEEIALTAFANTSREFAIELMAQTDGGDIKVYTALGKVLDFAESKLKRQEGMELKSELPT